MIRFIKALTAILALAAVVSSAACANTPPEAGTPANLRTCENAGLSDIQTQRIDAPGADATADEWTEMFCDRVLSLFIYEVGDGWFTANTFEPAYQFRVIYDLKGALQSGDVIDLVIDSLVAVDEGKTAFGNEVFIVTAKSVKKSQQHLHSDEWYKPVIYLYPEEKTEVRVRLEYNGKLTCTIPEYGRGWNVTAYPGGRIVNSDGAEYPYLFWEGEGKADYDLSKGFCVKGGDAEKFLCEKLAQMGMSKSEIGDFNDFWVPHLEKNPYNRICFQTTAYTENARLHISPEPDSMLRVFMVFTPLEEPVSMEEQRFGTFERKGFTVVEWGGAVTEGSMLSDDTV